MLDEVVLYTDGGSRGNPGEAAICYRVKAAGGEILLEHAERIGRATNNQAEYRALIAGLSACRRYTDGRVRCQSDSQLIVRQLRGEYRVKEPELKPLWERVQALEREFAEVTYTHVRRSDPDIARADWLVNQALAAG